MSESIQPESEVVGCRRRWWRFCARSRITGRAEGKRFDLATVLLYSILGMVAGANSYRQMHEFIRVHLERLNEAFGLRLPYSPSYTGLRLILQGVGSTALEAAFRLHGC